MDGANRRDGVHGGRREAPRPTSRRRFLGTLGAAAALGAVAPGILRAQSGSRVVVAGGGFAGATAAKYLKLWGPPSLEVVLIEPNLAHVSCVMSNLVLNERLRIADLRFNYDALVDRYGVQVIRDRVVGVDATMPAVRLRRGGWLSYDRLVLAPGITFDRVNGWDPDLVPHAWIAGAQTNLLRDRIRAMPDTGTFVMTVPLAPYRCPPGPYERACVVADILGRRAGVLAGRGPRAGTPKVVVLDANLDIQAERETFSRAFDTLYGDIIEYHPGVALQAVDSPAQVAITNAGEFQGDVLNVIPRHRAPSLLRQAGLTDGDRWAPVDPLSYVSTLPAGAGVHVIGDSQGSGQPKSGHMANAQAKVCADAVLRLLAGLPVNDAERMANIVTNSACYSPITFDQASWLTAVFAYDPVAGQMAIAGESLGEAGTWNQENFDDMFRWSENLFADTFG